MTEATAGNWRQTIEVFSVEENIDISPLLVFVMLATVYVLYWYVGLSNFIFAGAAFGADNSSHLAEIVKVAAALREGRFDAFWFSQSNLGYPLFTGYNLLPYLVMGTLVALTQGFWQPMHVYNTSIIFMHALVPLCWYASARLLRLPRLTSLCFALMPVFMSEYTLFGLTASTTMSMGLYHQMWALPLFPLVFACYYHFLILETRGSVLATVLCHSLLCSVHNLLGFFAGIGGLLFLVLRRQCWRKYLVSQLSILLLFSYWLVVWFNDHIYLVKIAMINHPIYSDGFLRTISHLAAGEFFDYNRAFPLLTVLLAIGLLVILRKQTLLRAWAVYFMLFGIVMLLYAPGDSLLGRVIPLFQEIPFRRYVSIMQMGGALVIAWGMSYLLLKAARIVALTLSISHRTAMRDLVVIVALLSAMQHVEIAQRTFRTMTINTDFAAASEFLQKEKHARFLVHGDFGTGSHFFRNLLPLLSDRSQLLSYARGIRDTLSSYYTIEFDFAPLSYELFNVRYIVSYTEVQQDKRADFSLRKSFGEIFVYGADNEYGYFDVVQSNFAVTAFTTEAAVEFLRSNSKHYYGQGVLPFLTHEPPTDMPFIAFEGKNARYYLQAESRAVSKQQFDAQVLQAAQRHRVAIQETVNDYSYRAQLDLDAPTYLLLKASYHPNWRAQVNGVATPVHAVAPNLMAVPLSAGQHEVVFRYHNQLLPQILFLLCALAWLILLAIWLRNFVFASKPPVSNL